MIMIDEEDEYDVYYNKGFDACLQGVTFTPMLSGSQLEAWLDGWHDALGSEDDYNVW